MVEVNATPGARPSPPMVEVRAACGEPRDHLRQSWNRITVARKPVSTSDLEARRLGRRAPRPSDGRVRVPDHRAGGRQHPSTASRLPPMVEVRAACGEPRDHLRRCWIRSRGTDTRPASGEAVQTSPRANPDNSCGVAESNPTTSSIPASLGSAIVKPVDVMPTTTSFALGFTSRRYCASAWCG